MTKTYSPVNSFWLESGLTAVLFYLPTNQLKYYFSSFLSTSIVIWSRGKLYFMTTGHALDEGRNRSTSKYYSSNTLQLLRSACKSSRWFIKRGTFMPPTAQHPMTMGEERSFEMGYGPMSWSHSSLNWLWNGWKDFHYIILFPNSNRSHRGG